MAVGDFFDETVYHQVRLAKVSQDCEGAAENYFDLIAPLCPVKPAVAHALMRIAMRPVFYLGITDRESMTAYIVNLNKERPDFLQWLRGQDQMLGLILKELTICCFFYDLRYNKQKKLVLIDHASNKKMVDVFIEVPDRNMYQEFPTFCEFKKSFYALFQQFPIARAELDRLILEEDYNKYFLL